MGVLRRRKPFDALRIDKADAITLLASARMTCIRYSPKVQARLAEVESRSSAAFADENARGVLCHHGVTYSTR
ncbi:hypothetical protein VTI28DRAFT_1959 [Corynascus sepedonium]